MPAVPQSSKNRPTIVWKDPSGGTRIVLTYKNGYPKLWSERRSVDRLGKTIWVEQEGPVDAAEALAHILDQRDLLVKAVFLAKYTDDPIHEEASKLANFIVMGEYGNE